MNDFSDNTCCYVLLHVFVKTLNFIMADAYRIKEQHVAYFITLTVVDWLMFLQEKNIGIS